MEYNCQSWTGQTRANHETLPLGAAYCGSILRSDRQMDRRSRYGMVGRGAPSCTIAIDSPVYSTSYCIPGFDSSGQWTMGAGDITTFSDMAASSWRQAEGDFEAQLR